MLHAFAVPPCHIRDLWFKGRLFSCLHRALFLVLTTDQIAAPGQHERQITGRKLAAFLLTFTHRGHTAHVLVGTSIDASLQRHLCVNLARLALTSLIGFSGGTCRQTICCFRFLYEVFESTDTMLLRCYFNVVVRYKKSKTID